MFSHCLSILTITNTARSGQWYDIYAENSIWFVKKMLTIDYPLFCDHTLIVDQLLANI